MANEFSVSEARSAIICPRIFYFDEVRHRAKLAENPQATKYLTRIWNTGGKEPIEVACGALFHHTIEKFNKLAATASEVRKALQLVATGPSDEADEQFHVTLRAFINRDCLNRQRLAEKAPGEQKAFVDAINRYLGEIVGVLGYAVRHGRGVEELLNEFFGDNTKRVDVTFHVGPGKTPVRIRGIIDFIYYDFRHRAQRIIDFKLMPGDALYKDIYQAAIYALMHNQQHQTRCDVAIMYLHPELHIASLTWGEVDQKRAMAFDLLASMTEWSNFNERTGEGLRPPGETSVCAKCSWNKNGECEKRLGPKIGGDRVKTYEGAADRHEAIEPLIEARRPPSQPPTEMFEGEPDEADAMSSEVISGVNSHCESSPELYIGRTAKHSKAVNIPLAALNTHVSVMGAAGSGKSWLAKVVAEEAILQGVPVLAIDPQGDLVQFLKPAMLGVGATDVDRAAQNRFRDRVEVRVWTPGTSHGIRLGLSPLRLPREVDLAGIENPQRRREEWEALLGVVAGNLVQLASASGDEEIQRTFVLEILRALTSQRSDRDLGLNDIIGAMNAPEDYGIDAADDLISKSEREKLKRRLSARLRGPTAPLFNGGQVMDIQRFVNPVEPGKTPLNVVYLNALPDDSQKQYVVASLAAEVYRWMITSVSNGATRLLVFLDEARDFLPAGASKPPAKEPLLRLFSQGRKFGVSCLICTQSPRSVDYQAFSNASSKLIGRLEAAQDVQRVAEWFDMGGSRPDWLFGRKGAERGTFAGRWPGMSEELSNSEFHSRLLFSLHEGAWSPSRVESEWAQATAARHFVAEPSSP